jgi:predicted Zn-dependent protease
VIETLGAPAHVELVEERVELLRFGGSRLTYQHSEERVTLRARIVRDDREVWGTLGSVERAAVTGLRERLETLARALPPGRPSALPKATPRRGAVTAFRSTMDAGADDRVALYRQTAASLPADAELGGSVTHVSARHGVANSEGLFVSEERTRAVVQVVASIAGRSSWSRLVARDADVLGVPDLASGLAVAPRRDLTPGRYRAVLSAQAVGTLLAALGQVGFARGAAGSLEDRVGEQLFSPFLTVTDDGCDPAGLPSTFDSAGVAKAHVPLVEAGVVHGVVTAETGHSVPPGWRFGGGPAPSHLVLAPGTASDDDLLAACSDGISIQRLDYVRVVQPRQTLVTGSSRDATLWVEQGRVVARLPQFRFTLRLDETFAGISALGARRERGDTPFLESVVAPAMAVDSFPVDLVTG